MATFSLNDILFVTLLQRGVAQLNLRLTGMADFSQIINEIRNSIPGIHGLATVQVRNTSSGWNSSRAVLLR